MQSTKRPWFRAGWDGADVLTWEGWIALAAVCLTLAVSLRLTVTLSDGPRFALGAALLLAANQLLRRKMIDPSDTHETAPQRWTSWLPIVAALAFMIVLSRVPGLDGSLWLAIVALALLPVAAIKYIIERRAARS